MQIGKKYDIKIYSRLMEYLGTINPNEVMNQISFTSSLDGTQGELSLQLTPKVNIDCGNILEIFCYDEFNKTGRMIYKGFVSQLENIYSSGKTYNVIKVLGIGALLGTSYYTTTGNSTKSMSDWIEEVCTEYNTIYGYDLFSVGTIEDSSEYSLDFNDEGTFLSKLETIVKSGDNYYYIDQFGKINVYKKPLEATHYVTYKKNVEQLKLSYNIESIINQYRVKAYCRGSGGNNTFTKEDLGSIARYGVKSQYLYTDKYYYLEGAEKYVESLISQKSTPKNNTTIIVNSLYDILSIIPGEGITVMNIDKEVENLQIKKVSYNGDKVTLTLEETEKFSDYLSFKS